jgi:hypothetical protein
MYNFFKFMTTKRHKKIFFTPLIRDPGWVKIRVRDPGSGIRDKHPGSATLLMIDAEKKRLRERKAG